MKAASNLVLSLALLVALGGMARAQDQGGLKPTDDKGGAAPAPATPAPPGAPAPATDPVAPPPNTPQAPATADTPTVEGTNKDPGGWKAQTPPPAQAGVPEASDPLAAKPAPAPVDPAVEEETRRKNDRIIDRNYEDAIKTYEHVLSNEGESSADLDHRIKTNEDLIARYKKLLAQANDVKRREQVELFNRTFYLKQQRDKGAIPEDTFDKLMKTEEKKYNDKTAAARSDIDFYEKEIADADKRLNDLRAERRVSVATYRTNQYANGKPKKPPMKPSQRMVGTLKEKLARLSEFDPKHTMDSASVEETVLAPNPGAAPQGQAPGPDAGPPAPPQPRE